MCCLALQPRRSCRPGVQRIVNESLRTRIAAAHEVARELGLDPGDVRYLPVPAHIMYSQMTTGLPGMWSHWSDGRDYWITKARHDAGHIRLYEMVVPTQPRLALMLDANDDIVNLSVAAHVMGHTHVFGANAYHNHENPYLLETVRVWRERIEGYEEEHGDLVVEQFIDKVLSLWPFASEVFTGKEFKEVKPPPPPHPDLYDAPPPTKPEKQFQPTGDLYGFIARYAEGLEEWQRDILEIYRELTVHDRVALRTKVLHEGFAALVQRRIMEKLDVSDAEWLDHSSMLAGVMSPGHGDINPYWLGHAIFEDVEKREGWMAVLDIVASDDDVSFVRNNLTEELVEELNLFSFRFYDDSKLWITDSDHRDWEVIRDALVRRFDGFRSPRIEITDFDYKDRRGLLLEHRYDGRRLDLVQAEGALVALADLWQQPVYLHTTARRQGKEVDLEGVAFAPYDREDEGEASDWVEL